MKNKNSHITVETEALFKEFMVETESLSTNSADKSIPSNISPELLLSLLSEAKQIIGSLQLKDHKGDKELSEVSSRLERIEKDLSELKVIISNQ
ncbi:MAG: hypothetical protein KAG19_03380 [Methylococcales bacterium]|nr:hypothetical protein [Methylococcales bacterium]